MRRFWPLIAFPLLLLAGCRIEQTPTRYIDRLETPEEEVRASTEELTDRLLSTGPSLQRRNLGDLVAALAPHPQLTVFGPAAGEVLGDGASLGFALSDIAMGREVTLDSLIVEVGPGNDVAWFRSAYVVQEESGEATRVPFTGVFVRQEGEWRLRQAHLSPPVTPEAAPAEADTVQAGG